MLFVVVAVLWSLSLFTTSSTQGYNPELNLATEDVTLLANSTLEVECAGKMKLQWIFPADWRSLISTNAEVTETFYPNRSKPYVSTLRIEELEYRFTGRYICAYIIAPKVNEDDYQPDIWSTSVYVYVYDAAHLLAPLDNKTSGLGHFTVFSSSQLVLPCRPTRPEIKVELSQVSDDIKRDFDPQRGFIIEYPDNRLQGMFYCIATYEGLQYSQSFILTFAREATIPPRPKINTSEAKHPSVNRPFRLTCEVYADTHTKLDIFWKFPDGAEDVEVRNISIAPVLLRSTQPAQRLSKVLEVTSATKNHTGNYTCIAATFFQTYPKTVFIEVQDRLPQPYITLSSHVSSPLFVNASRQIKLVVNYEYHIPNANGGPLVPHSEWTKDGILLEPANNVSVESNSGNLILKIDGASVDNTGLYTLYARIGGDDGPTANWSVSVLVRSIPQVHIANGEHFYKLNKRFILKCQGKGYPLPKVWWLWSPCITAVKPCDGPWTDVELLSSGTSSFPNGAGVLSAITESSIRASRNISLVAKLQGSLKCKASNDIGISEYVIPFIVSEDPAGHWLSTPKTKAIEGQVANMTCGASKLVYSSLMWSTVGRSGTIIHNGTGDMEITEGENAYSIISTLTFKTLNMSHNQQYRCTAMPIKNGTEVANISKSLLVIGRSVPRFVNESIPTTVEYELPAFQTVRFSCDHRLGMPPPQVFWLKDGKKLDMFQRNGIEEQESSLVINRVMAEDGGIYTCVVKNSVGHLTRNFSLNVFSEPEAADSSQWIYIGIGVVVGPLLIVLITVLLIKICKEKRERKEQELLQQSLFDRGQMFMFNPDMPLDEQVNLLPYNQKWEFPRDRLRLGRVLGQGAFGRVVKAEAVGLDDSETHTTVAVKMLKERADSVQLKALVAELKILIHLGSHLNILNLLGAVTKNMSKGELMVIVEYCRYGNIRNYLLRYRHNFRDQLDPVTGRVDISRTLATDDEDYLSPNEHPIGNGFSNPNYQGVCRLPDVKLNYAHLQHTQTTTGSESEASTTYPASPGSNSTNPWDSAGFTTSSGTVQFRSRLASEAMTLTKKTLCTCDLLCFAFQCARGMEYLASRKLIHRDLAARNVLLAEDNIVKICDFGLAKDCYKDDAYVKKNDGPLPIKWMAIESIGDKVFTIKSDVWSFGVLLWEFFTLGSNPYPGIELDEDFYRKLKNGYRMEKPRYAPDDVYNLMTSCWQEDPLQRPTFDVLSQALGDLLESGVRQYYVELNTPYMEMNCDNLSPVDYLSMETQEGGTNYLTMATESCTAHYDNVTNVRPVEGDGPTPLEPLEVVPMIQLEPVVLTNVNRNKSFRKALTPPASPTRPKVPPKQCENETQSKESALLDRYPSTEDDDDVASVVFELNTSLEKNNEDYMTMGNVTHLDRSRKGNESMRSAASSGFHSDFEPQEGLSPPPSYNLVIDNVV